MAIADFMKHNYSANSNPPQTVSASSVVAAGYEAWRAGDNVITDSGMWYAGAFENAWWKLDTGLGYTYLLDNYSFRTPSLSALRPKAWTMAGSNNDTDWDTIDTRSGLTLAVSTVCNYTCATRTTAYRYFRWWVTDTEGGRPASQEFWFFGEAPSGGVIVVPQLLSHRRRRVA